MVCAYLEEDVDILVVFEYMLEFYNMSVIQGFVDFDFSNELKLSKKLLFA